MSARKPGQVVTFYSYKGGTGRTMALANIAWILAANGKRVLMVDWDLESPGLHRYFAKSLLDPDALAATKGVVNMVREFEESAAETPEEERGAHYYRDQARVGDYAIAIRWPFPDGGVLHYMSAGLQNRSYSSAVASLDWERFYEHLGGGELFNAFRADMKAGYDYALIDSRTGLSDVADICTLHLPDVIVDCFTLNNQGLEGALTVAAGVSKFTNHPIRLLAVPMRVDEAEKNKADAGRAAARERFAELKIEEMASPRYWGQVEIPYVPYYGYEETLAAFADSPNDRHTLLDAYLRLASVLTGGEVTGVPEMDEAARKSLLAEISRLQPTPQEQLAVAYVAQDRLWAEWIEAVYLQAGFDVQTIALFDDPQARATPEPHTRIVALMSSETTRNPGAMSRLRTWSNSGRLSVVTLAELRSDARPAAVATCELHGVTDPAVAVALLLRLAGVADSESGQIRSPESHRYPTGHPRVWNVAARSSVFTGRDEVMERLRQHVVGGSATVILPVALHGLGGVGKTQLAQEYALRFSADYDLVWWIGAESTEFIDEALAGLARRLRLPGTGDSITEDSAAVREAMRRGEVGRWLLVYDNATEPSGLAPFLPSGSSGHVLITSRDQAWAQRAIPLEVDVFTSAESAGHLTRTVPGLTERDALRLAELVGHLPLAVQSAGAWLSTTGTPVEQYLEQLSAQITRVLETPPDGYPVSVAATWTIALEDLRERRPAAARLLELCAFLNPDGISTSQLIYTTAMLQTLRGFDRALVDIGMIGTVVAEPVRLSLLQLDQAARELRIHRLVQEVIKARMSPQQRDEALHAVHDVLASARPQSGDTDDPANWPQYVLLWPHLAPSRAMDCDQGPVRQLLIDRIRYLWKRGEYQNALESGIRLEAHWVERIEELGGQRSDPGSLLYQQLLVLRNLIGSVLRLQGEFDQAYRIDSEVLAEQERLFGPEHPHTLLSHLCLAGDLRGLGRFQEALERDLATFERHRRVYPEGDARLLGAANNLAVNYRLVGDCHKALELDQSTYIQRRSTLGPRHPYTLYSGSNLARDLRDAGQYGQSVDLLRAALADYREAVGDGSPETLRTAKSLAASLRKAGELTESVTLAQETLDRYRSGFGETNPDLRSCALVYAAALSAVGEHDEAKQLCLDVLAGYESRLGPQHPYTLCCVNNLAAYARKTGEFEQALTLARRAFEGLTGLLGDWHPYTLIAAANLANSLVDNGDLRPAAILEQDAARKLADVLRPDHPDVLALESNHAVTLDQLGHAAEAAHLRVRVVARLELTMGPQHFNTRAARQSQRLDWDLEPQPI
ncbi:tetratricopeptide repeat protein [Actinospica durhamensis]|uniref:Tetratricopeptide repeat protein n=1 Tax=Actinospica durhamensis TaxID=1508375 RepID=A0A941EL89_9ACTN|nr:FxSxx-COOH system tetratricopeptide repeat protein [Actinospica durhamensis]MBR7832413.1 tetratricopeptide repeat protein [Actinospica durhamensis]